MSDFYNPQESREARKLHRCTYCGEPISPGETYTYQKGVYDGRWYETKMHPECFDACFDDAGDDVYTPYSNERPQALDMGK